MSKIRWAYTLGLLTGPWIATGSGLADFTDTDKVEFLNKVGFSFDNMTSWSGDMLRMLLGNGIGIFSTTMPWIIAFMVVIGAFGMVGGAYRFFKH